jgi:hypothetical protein
LAEARDVLPEPGADLRTVCSGEPELFSAAHRVVEEHCFDEKPSAQERAPRLDEWVPSGAEAPDTKVAHCLDVRGSALEQAQAVTVLVQAESVQVSYGSEPVGSAAPEFFPVCPHGFCSFRRDARLPLHRVVHG